MVMKNQPMFKILLDTLQNQKEEDKAMFFADSETELLKAYREGREAKNKKIPADRNPYPKPSERDSEKYTKYLCWAEGYMDVCFFGNEKE